MNEENKILSKEEIPFPPRTYAEARAYYAESDEINIIRTAKANGFLEGYIKSLEASGLGKEEIGGWKARIAIAKKMLIEGNMSPLRINFYTCVPEELIKEFYEILTSNIDLEAEGEYSKALKVARSFKAKGYPIEDIMEATELTKEEIEKL